MKKDNVLVKVMLGIALFGCVAVAVAGTLSSYPPQSMLVGTSSTLIAPSTVPATISTRAVSSTQTLYSYVRVYSNGTSTVKFGQPLEYICIVTGVTATTNLANWNQTNDVTDGAVTWRPINQNRKAITIINDSTSTMYLAFGAPAVLNKGLRLNANGGSATRDWRGAVYGISAMTNANACIQEE